MTKYELEDASVYLHVPDDDGPATVPHIDVCHPMVGQIVGDDNSTYVGGMSSGVFIGLKEPMLERFEQMIAHMETNRQVQAACAKTGDTQPTTQCDD
jgi:hypothetical protein